MMHTPLCAHPPTRGYICARLSRWVTVPSCVSADSVHREFGWRACVGGAGVAFGPPPALSVQCVCVSRA
eukprot:5538994-Prymnesium_polylepis.1